MSAARIDAGAWSSGLCDNDAPISPGDAAHVSDLETTVSPRSDDSSQEIKARSTPWFGYALLALLPLLIAMLVVAHAPAAENIVAALPANTPLATLLAHFGDPLPRFMLQLLVVLASAKFAGIAMRRLGQPAVIGEMLAGILLGPSLFGLLLPQAQTWLFPSSSLVTLNHVSQLGVLVFMFAAGAEVDLSRLRGRRGMTLLISHAGIALPFLLGILLAWPLFRSYAPNGIAFAGFAMFMGIALSVTAFPVLLRILEERGDSATPIGLIAITCAALSDATAWGMLGAIVALVKSQSLLGVTVSLALALIFAWLIVARARAWFAHRIVEEVREPQWMVALVLLILICALFTEAIGLHAMFGAFLAGIAVSRNTALRTLVEHKIEPFAAVLLLPVFFASTGLRTRIDLLSGSEWLLCLGIVGVATLGKLGGTAIAARWSGLSRIDALRLGSLMNTRGLMELIVLGLGYDLGIISQALYAILVLVAIITTVMTGPLLTAIDRFEARQKT